jgi:cell wall-associated NlpC family hydrolase
MAVVEAAREYLGKPWEWGGRNRWNAIDCIGLLVLVAEDLGLPTTWGMEGYTFNGYGRDNYYPDGHELSMRLLMAKPLIEIPVEDAGIGDIQCYWIRHRKYVCHCGILSDKGVIHTHQGSKKVVETQRRDFWDRRTSCSFRYPGIDNEGATENE